MKKYRVAKSQEGMGLLQFLKESFASAPSVKAIKCAIDQKGCSVNGVTQTFSSHKLFFGDLVCLNVEALQKKSLTAQVLYEDRDLLILNKPAGLVTSLKELDVKGYLVHRLDKETSGALLIAKTVSCRDRLIALFKKHQISKLYLALVDGCVKKQEGVVDNYLGKVGGYAGQTTYGKVARDKGVRAITHFRLLSASKSASLLLCSPKTGRTHQLRAHLSGMGHPILGDRQYAERFCSSLKPLRNLLHAYKLVLTHPTTQEEIKVTAPIPTDFKRALQTLKLSIGGG